jgi:cyclopropane-fatty-acyl-phospholipid synthase
MKTRLPIPRTSYPRLLAREIAHAFPERPFTIEFWDGSSLPSTNGNGPVFRATSPKALTQALRAPGQLGIGRAYVAGQIEVDDLDAAIRVVDTWQPPALERLQQTRLALAALIASGFARPGPTPTSELALTGQRHSVDRDAQAVRHHYDVSNDFFRLFLDESMTYSCAFFGSGAETLEDAQFAKLETVCRKLGLQPGERVLDVGCGWGSFALHAAREHGVSVVGITLSEPQAQLARERVADAGLSDQIDIRVADYRLLDDDPFDAISSIGMVEHVGEEQIDVYAERLAALLKPNGRLLNHGIARLNPDAPNPGAFSERYVFPDGDPVPLSRMLLALERAGFTTEHVEGYADDYAETLRRWAQRLDDNLGEAERLAGPERLRVWRLYLRAARNGFEVGFTSIYQVRARKS